MRPILICLLFLFHLVCTHAQRSPNEKEAVVDSLLKQAHSAYNDIDLLSSMESALEANSISEDINYSEGIARSNFYIAQVLSSVGDYDQSLEYLSLAEKEIH